MKKVLAVFLGIMLALVMAIAPSLADTDPINWDALTETTDYQDPTQNVGSLSASDTTESATGGIDWTDIITKVVVWVIGAVGAALSALLVNVTKKYIYPWLRDTAVPWLKQNGLLEAAKAAVKYAEAELGRYTGDDKWLFAKTMLAKKGYDINSTEVIGALKSAWLDLNISQIAAGIKEAEYETTEIADMRDEQLRAVLFQMDIPRELVEACSNRDDLEALLTESASIGESANK